MSSTQSSNEGHLQAVHDEREPMATWKFVLLCALGGLLFLGAVGWLRDAPSLDDIRASSVDPIVGRTQEGLLWLNSDGSIDFGSDSPGQEPVPVWDPQTDNDRAVSLESSDRRIVLTTVGGDVIVVDTLGGVGNQIRVWQGASQTNPHAVSAVIANEHVSFIVEPGHVFVHDLAAWPEMRRQRVWGAVNDRGAAVALAVGGTTAAWALDNGNAFAQDTNIEGADGLRRVWGQGQRTAALNMAVTTNGLVGFRLANGNVRVDSSTQDLAVVAWSADNNPAAAIGVDAAGPLVGYLLDDGSVRMFDESLAAGKRNNTIRTETQATVDHASWFDTSASGIVARSDQRAVLTGIDSAEGQRFFAVPADAVRVVVLQ